MHPGVMIRGQDNITCKLESITVYQIWTKLYLKSMKSRASHKLAHMSIAFNVQ